MQLLYLKSCTVALKPGAHSCLEFPNLLLPTSTPLSLVIAPHSTDIGECSLSEGNESTPAKTVSKTTSPYAIERYRQLVPIACQKNTTYLNASLQPPINNVVRGGIEKFLEDGQNLPYPKTQWVQLAEESRELLGKCLNVAAETMAFTRDTTEALNLFQRSLIMEAGDNVVVLDVEHPNQTYGWLALGSEKGIEVRQVSTVGKGLVRRRSIIRATGRRPYQSDRYLIHHVSFRPERRYQRHLLDVPQTWHPCSGRFDAGSGCSTD